MTELKMKNSKGIITKVFSFVMVSMILMFTYLPFMVQAEEKTESANDTSNSMIKFFQEDRTSLQVDSLSGDEVKVYGVFLSNFFIPWRTQIKDIVTPNDLPKKISTKFFGSDGKSKEVLAVNKKVQEGITTTLKGSANAKKRYAMYNKKGDSKAMSGEDFYKKMAGIGGYKIYGEDNKEYMDLNSPAFRASLKILFGISPKYMLSKDMGLRKLTALYIDGFGNVWGAYDGATVEDYVLVMPAAMNPSTFSNKGSEYRFPAANVFAMGASTTFRGENVLNDSSPLTPYFAVGNKFPKGGINDSLVSIIGVNSPLGYLGNSDSAQSGVSSNPKNAINKYINQDADADIKSSESRLLVTFRHEKMPDLSNLLAKDKTLDLDEKVKLTQYLMNTTDIKLTEVADNMYYFKIPNAQSQNASDSNAGSFSEPKDLIKSSTLYTSSTKPIGEVGQKFKIYKNSFFASPFDRFLYDFRKADSKTQDNMMKQIVKSDVSKNSLEFKDLKYFLINSDFPSRQNERISNAVGIIKQTEKGNIYGVVNSAKVSGNHSISKYWFVTLAAMNFSYGLTTKDGNTIVQNALAQGTNKGQSKPNNKGLFQSEIGRPGSIKNKGTATDAEVNGLATYMHTMLNYRIFTMNETVAKELTSSDYGKSIKTVWKEPYKQYTPRLDGINNFPGMYWSYMVDLLSVTGTEKDGKVDFKSEYFIGKHLPPMKINTTGGDTDLNNLNGQGITESEDKSLLEMTEDIVRKSYSLMSTEPSTYRDQLFKATQDSWIIQTHRDITSSWTNNTYSVSAGANGSYSTVVGFINTPSLQELPITNWILSDYFWIYLSLAVLIIIVTTCMVIVSAKTVREGLIVVLVGMFLLILPQFLVNGVVSTLNKTTDKMYSEKFNFWAITQHQQSVKKLKDAQTSTDSMDYIIASSMQSAKNVYSNDVGVQVKWMSPKKDDVFDKLFNRSSSQDSLTQNSTIFRWLFNSYLNQEMYDYSNPLATYVYKPYNAIASDANDIYTSVSDKAIDPESVIGGINQSNFKGLGIPDYKFKAMQVTYKSPVQYVQSELEDIEAIKTRSSEATANIKYPYRYWILNNQDVNTSIFRNDYTESPGFVGTNTDDPYYKAYSALTESPFYYFYFAIKSNYSKDNASFKEALLDSRTFKVDSSETPNNDLYGFTKDFLDMEGLFTYVVPYLEQGNNYVKGWRKLNGEGVDAYDFEKGIAPNEKDSPELIAKYEREKKKKEELKNVWKLYTPWVDQIYNLGVMQVRSTSGKTKISIADSLNPAAYDKAGRGMVFSRADMIAKKYNESDLTDVEHRILDTLEDTKKDMYYLSNYYDFDEETLITASAMMATFNFNKNFSKARVFDDSVELYPKGFELKNFNYDAFSRMMLVNATGEPLTTDKENDDLYVRIIKKTNLFVGIMLIASDILGVYVVPFVKYMVLIAMLFLGLITVVSTILAPPEKILSKLWSNLFKPILVFAVATISFAWGVSYLMGDGLTGYVGGRTLSTGVTDPSFVLGAVIVLDVIYIVLLVWVILQMLKSLKWHAMSTFVNASTLGRNVAMGAVRGVKNFASSRGYSDDRGMSGYNGGYGGYRDSSLVGKMSSKGSGVAKSSATGTTKGALKGAKTTAKISGHTAKVAGGMAGRGLANSRMGQTIQNSNAYRTTLNTAADTASFVRNTISGGKRKIVNGSKVVKNKVVNNSVVNTTRGFVSAAKDSYEGNDKKVKYNSNIVDFASAKEQMAKKTTTVRDKIEREVPKENKNIGSTQHRQDRKSSTNARLVLLKSKKKKR